MVRPLLVFPVIMVIMLFPIGIFTGAFSQLSTAICGVPAGDADPTTYATSWFCSDARLARFLRNLLTGFLPSLLLSLYQVLVLPLAFYLVAQAEATSFSLEDLDYRCGELFFYWCAGVEGDGGACFIQEKDAQTQQRDGSRLLRDCNCS